jgi:hypothetical protein
METEPSAFYTFGQMVGWWLIFLVIVPWIAVVLAAHDRGNSMIGAGLIALLGTPLIGILYVLAQPVNRDVLDERAIRSRGRVRCGKCLTPKLTDAPICPMCGAGARVDAPATRSHFGGVDPATHRPAPPSRPAPSESGQGDVMPPGTSGFHIAEETFERAEPDQDAAAEFRRRMQQRDP